MRTKEFSEQRGSSDSLQVQMKVSGPVCMDISMGPQDKSRYSVTMVKGAM